MAKFARVKIFVSAKICTSCFPVCTIGAKKMKTWKFTPCDNFPLYSNNRIGDPFCAFAGSLEEEKENICIPMEHNVRFILLTSLLSVWSTATNATAVECDLFICLLIFLVFFVCLFQTQMCAVFRTITDQPCLSKCGVDSFPRFLCHREMSLRPLFLPLGPGSMRETAISASRGF